MRCRGALSYVALVALLLGAPVPGRAALRHPAADARADRTVDLHAHLFMKPGMEWFFRGDFNGPLRARDWRSRFSSQVNPETLEQSNIGLVVVALYANPVFSDDMREAIRKEIGQAEDFVLTHPDWVIARDPDEARLAQAEGKRIMVLSLEGADGVLDTEADLKEFVDARGIRIVTFLHIIDNRYGGVAFMRGYHKLGDPLRWLVELFDPTYEDGLKVNSAGLTDAGRAMARALLKRRVWIDLSHSSDASQRELIPMIEAAHMPLLYSHGGLRQFEKAERAVSLRQLEEVRKTGGLVGICPSEDVVAGTPVADCGSGCGHRCDFGLRAFAEHYRAAEAVVGVDSVMVGSDFNGALPHLRPSCGTGTELDREGYWNIGQTPALFEALRRVGVPLPARLSDQVTQFIDTWSRAMGE